MNKIELKNITVRYGKNTVLQNFDLTVEEGQILGIVGPSGCGKTTVVRAICGFLDPQEGTSRKPAGPSGRAIHSRRSKERVFTAVYHPGASPAGMMPQLSAARRGIISRSRAASPSRQRTASRCTSRMPTPAATSWNWWTR